MNDDDERFAEWERITREDREREQLWRIAAAARAAPPRDDELRPWMLNRLAPL